MSICPLPIWALVLALCSALLTSSSNLWTLGKFFNLLVNSARITLCWSSNKLANSVNFSRRATALLPPLWFLKNWITTLLTDLKTLSPFWIEANSLMKKKLFSHLSCLNFLRRALFERILAFLSLIPLVAASIPASRFLILLWTLVTALVIFSFYVGF